MHCGLVHAYCGLVYVYFFNNSDFFERRVKYVAPYPVLVTAQSALHFTPDTA